MTTSILPSVWDCSNHSSDSELPLSNQTTHEDSTNNLLLERSNSLQTKTQEPSLDERTQLYFTNVGRVAVPQCPLSEVPEEEIKRWVQQEIGVIRVSDDRYARAIHEWTAQQEMQRSQLQNAPTFAASNGWEDPQEMRLQNEALAMLLRCSDLWQSVFGEMQRCDISAAFQAGRQHVIEAARDLFRERGEVPQNSGHIIGKVVTQARLSERDEHGIRNQIRPIVEQCFAEDVLIPDRYECGEQLATFLCPRLARNPASNISGKSNFVVAMHLETLHSIQELIQELRVGGTRTPRLQVHSLSQLDAIAQPPRWLVHNIAVSNETLFIAGPMKSIKSGIALDFGICLAAPHHGRFDAAFLNHFSSEPVGGVLLFSAESGPWVVKKRIEQIISSKPHLLGCGNRRNISGSLADELNLHLCFDAPRLSDRKEQTIVRQMIRDLEAKVVIFDPFYLSALAGTKTEASNVYQMGEVIREIEQIIKSEGATPVFVHHFTKGVKPGTPPSLQQMTFSGAGEVAAQWILLNHRTAYDTSSGHARLTMIAGGRAGHSGQWAVDIIEGQLSDDFSGRRWQVEVMSPEQAREYDREAGRGLSSARGDQDREAMDHIQSVLAEYGTEGLCITPLAERSGMRLERCRRLCEHLVSLRRVRVGQTEVNGRSHQCYILTEAEPHPPSRGTILNQPE